MTPAARGTTAGTQDEPRDSHFVQSFQRGLEVIRAFDGEHPTMTLSEVARATGLARAAARRFLLTLVELGYLRVEDRRFRLTPRVLELGQAYLAGLSLPELALPWMRDFVAEKRESASLAVLDGDEIVYVAHVTASRIMSVAVGVGTRDPAVTTSLGRVLLAGQPDEWLEGYVANVELVRLTEHTITSRAALAAELEVIRAQGWAMVDQELEEGVCALAAPIHDAAGDVIASVNVAVNASRWTRAAMREQLLPGLLDVAAQIDRDARASRTG